MAYLDQLWRYTMVALYRHNASHTPARRKGEVRSEEARVRVGQYLRDAFDEGLRISHRIQLVLHPIT
jgi:hypothetical protein